MQCVNETDLELEFAKYVMDLSLYLISLSLETFKPQKKEVM